MVSKYKVNQLWKSVLAVNQKQKYGGTPKSAVIFIVFFTVYDIITQMLGHLVHNH